MATNSSGELTSLVIEPEHILEDLGEVGDRVSGSYGFVYNVKVRGVVRIAKKPHTFYLKKTSVVEKANVLASFNKECVLLNKLRHPNIVKFIGVYFGQGGEDDISMVMEKVHFELASFLRENWDVQLATKLSILQDVSYGLVYLHEYNPPIIHRDLTARNILLTKAYQAKIADVGVAKLLDQTAMKATSHTKAPGQMFYMPPEACMEKAECTSKLDIFSFGHLSLHVLLEDYPEVFEVKVTSKMLSDGTVQIMRRKSSLDRIGSSHCLYPLITQCLMDEPEKRPNTRAVNSTIADIKEANSSDAGEIQRALRMEGHHIHDVVSKLKEIVQESKENSVKVTDLLAEKSELDKKLEERDTAILALQHESNMIILRNQDLETKCARLSSPKNSDLVKTISDQAKKVKELQAYIEVQSRTVAKLREDHEAEVIAEMAKYQEVKDERDRLNEDFQSARESIDHLRKQVSSSKQQTLASPDIQESNLLKEDLAAAQLCISGLEKSMEQLKNERDTALDKAAIGSAQAEIFKADFDVEREDRERAQGLLDVYKNKNSSTKMYEKIIADLKKELHAANQNLVDSKKKLSETEVEFKKCRSGSVAVIKDLRTNIEKIIGEKDYYYQENEQSKSLLREVKAELRNTKDVVNQLQKETDNNKAKDNTSLHATVKRKERLPVKTGHEIKSGSKTRIQLIESGNQNTKAKFQSDSKTEVNCSKTDTILKDQIQYTESIEIEIENLKRELQDLKFENDKPKKLMMEKAKCSGVPMEEEESKTTASGADADALVGRQYCDQMEAVAPGPQNVDRDAEIKQSLFSKSHSWKVQSIDDSNHQVEIPVNYPLRAVSMEPPFNSSWEAQARPNYGYLGSSESPVQNSCSTHISSHSIVVVDHQQHLEGDSGGFQGAQNFPPRMPRDTEHPYKQGFQIEPQEYQSEEMPGNKINNSYPSERSQDSIYNPDTADTIPERPKRLTHGINIPDYLVTESEKAGLECEVKAFGGDSHAAVAESSSEGSIEDQLLKDIDEEIHRFAELLKEQVNPDSSHQVTEVVQLPLDRNLVCPILSQELSNWSDTTV